MSASVSAAGGGLPDGRAVRWLALGLVVASGLVLAPYVPWVILAVWLAGPARRAQRPLARILGNRPRLAATVTLVVAALLVVPVAVWLTLLAADAVDLVRRLLASDRAQGMMRTLVSGDGTRSPSSSDLVELAVSQGGRAWSVAGQVAGTAARMVIGLVVLIAGIYAVLVEGAGWYVWVEAHAPVSAETVRRLADAFTETGRGLLVGIFGAGLAQATVATLIFVLLGVPEPFALGLLTLVASIIPAVGTAMVWAPVAVGLALTGRVEAAAVLVVAGVAVIGTIDNLVRPYLARRGHLHLPTYLVLVAMFSGIIVLGPWGLLVAPLILRLAKEALAILRDEPAATPSPRG